MWIIINICSYREKYKEHPCVCCTDINILPNLPWILLSNNISIEFEEPFVLFPSFHRNRHPGSRNFIVHWVVTCFLKNNFASSFRPSQLLKHVGNYIEYVISFLKMYNPTTFPISLKSYRVWSDVLWFTAYLIRSRVLTLVCEKWSHPAVFSA